MFISKIHRSFKVFFILSLSHIYINALQFFLFLYLANILSPEPYGFYIGTLLFSSIIYLISDFGLSWSGVKYIATKKQNKRSISYFFWTCIFIQITIYFSCAAISLAIAVVTEIRKEYYFSLFSGLIIALCQIFTTTWFFNGLENPKAQAIPTMASKTLIFPLFIIFVNTGDDIHLALLFTILSSALGVLINFWVIYSGKFINRPRLNFIYLNLIFRHNLGIFFSKSTISLKDYLTPLFVANLLGTNSLGLFSMAEKVKTAATSLTTPFALTLFPKMSLFAVSDSILFNKISLNLIICASLAMLPICLLLYFFNADIIFYTSGNNYSESAVALGWMSPLPLLMVINNILGMQILIPKNKEEFFILSHFLGLIAGIVSAYYLIPINNIAGASQSLLISEIFTTSLLFIFVLKVKN